MPMAAPSECVARIPLEVSERRIKREHEDQGETEGREGEALALSLFLVG